ncbi:hypothetical protein NOV72_04999 [Caballeronia novacaledonica]|uniref:Uncharacterized protein n=1 Tax=Caballeronia novacaledonica TaxID=1544861 RepID=A0A2U3IC60_9BURK|nr:hypothetical protein [Caballeronia novacaledonica]SPB17796.1 hypothetical protein NOV72_04999 [Caballeronia novacaledonica]
MDNSCEIKKTERYRPPELTSKLFLLLEVLLADAATDVELVARELGLRDEMRERLRRALDRVDCAQGVLEAIASGAAGVSGSGSHDGGADDGSEAMERIRTAVELLAENWPRDYADDAVELLILHELRM